MQADPIEAACRRDFFPAYHESGSRSLGDIFWIVLHDEEAPTAAGAAHYFQSPGSGGSAHLCVDDQTCYRCLPNSAIPWGASSSFGANTHGFHIEQAGYARWTGTVWQRKHLRTLKRAAFKTALHCHAFGIEPRFVTAKDLPGKSGITTHAEISKASRRRDPLNVSNYSHTDPGFGWPRWLFMRYVRAYYKTL